jgi:NAD(P)-dependent dehydrogenase (short-subunit alcohol dehydrogenase family)
MAARLSLADVNPSGLQRVADEVEDFDPLVSVNICSTSQVCQAVGRAIIAHGHGGRIINTSSLMGSVGYPGQAVYCTTKHAVNGLIKALAVEWATHGITVNAVAPTFVGTPLTRPMFDDEVFRADVERRIPRGRLGTLDEVAPAVGFLASPLASLVNGDILLVDGWWVAW